MDGCTGCSLHKRAWPKGQIGAETQPLLCLPSSALVQGCVYLEAGTPFFNLTKILYELSETMLMNALRVLPSLILKTALWAT